MRHKKNVLNNLPVLLSATVFVIILLTMVVLGITVVVMLKAGIIEELARPHFSMALIIMAIMSIAVGTTITFLISRVPLKPLHTIISAMRQVAGGNFKLRLQPRGTGGDLYELYSSFNSMVKELDSVEILREDFVNNFSHEFKTPIVSIRGFAKMLKSDQLAPRERDEYLNIIIDESDRLVSLSTSVLQLTRLEHQAIISDAADFPVGEQLRRCILLLQTRWEEKKLNIYADIQDVDFYGSESLLGQVWMNLLDNSIKFTPEGGHIYIHLSQEAGQLVCRLQNSSPPVSPEGLSRIFEKFYQGDPSRTTSGNGLGLSIVSKAATLHGGSVTVQNLSPPDCGVEFTVTLPMTAYQI